MESGAMDNPADQPASGPIRVAIIEDDRMVRETLAEVIAASGDFVVTGTADSISAAAALLRDPADIYLLDLGLPDGSGIALIPHIRAAGEARIVVLTSFGDRDTVVKTIEAGADGYLLKDSTDEAIVASLHSARDGGAPISPAVAVHLLQRLRAGSGEAAAEPAKVSDTTTKLTPREIELLQLFAQGYSYKAASRMLGISPLTVGTHVRSIYRKLDVHSRGEAVFEAVRTGKLTLG